MHGSIKAGSTIGVAVVVVCCVCVCGCSGGLWPMMLDQVMEPGDEIVRRKWLHLILIKSTKIMLHCLQSLRDGTSWTSAARHGSRVRRAASISPQSHESEVVSLGCPSAAWAPPLSLSLLLWIVGEVPATRDTGWLCQDGGASEPTGGGPLKAAAVAPEPAAERLGEETDASSSMEPAVLVVVQPYAPRQGSTRRSNKPSTSRTISWDTGGASC